MKLVVYCIIIAFCLALPCEAYALPGDMGFFGGCSEGRRLPKTMETIITGSSRTSANTNESRTFLYKEVLFLDGRPAEFTGLLEVSGSGGVTPNSASGEYTQNIIVFPSPLTGEDVRINRNIVYIVNYRKEGRQIIKDYTIRDWAETIELNGAVYSLDPTQSGFDISIIEHDTPGITFYRGDLSQRSVYLSNSSNTLIVDAHDAFYGYGCAWSATETHRLDSVITADAWQMQLQIRPSVSVYKVLRYTDNEPEAISFEGNYKEVLQSYCGLKYDILESSKIFPDQERHGSSSIPLRNTFEQLIAPDLAFLTGHPAKEDISQLFSMQILEGDPKFYQPDQAITRGQYVTALTKAIKLPVVSVAAETRGRRNEAPPIVFPDVLPHRPDYPYIMAAYRNGVALGRDYGTFYADALLERQEAIVIAMRALGLTNLGSDPTVNTGFTDDSQIAVWARRSIAAAMRLGLIKPDISGGIRPKDYVSKAEAAAILRSLVDYMRYGLAKDYSDHLVNFMV